MPIMTKPNSIAKDAINTFSLDKSALGACASVVADSWFSQQSNWKKVRVNYLSTLGRQFITVVFDATKASPTGVFYAVSPCRENFEIFSLEIEDFNNDKFRVNLNDVVKSEFSIAFGPVFAWDTGDLSKYTLGANGAVSTAVNNAGAIYSDAVKLTSPGSQSFSFEVKFNGYMLNSYTYDWQDTTSVGFVSGTDLNYSSLCIRFDGTNNPKVRILSGETYRIADYGAGYLNAGENTIKFSCVNNQYSITVNGFTFNIGGVGFGSVRPFVRLYKAGESITSTKIV